MIRIIKEYLKYRKLRKQWMRTFDEMYEVLSQFETVETWRPEIREMNLN